MNYQEYLKREPTPLVSGKVILTRDDCEEIIPLSKDKYIVILKYKDMLIRYVKMPNENVLRTTRFSRSVFSINL